MNIWLAAVLYVLPVLAATAGWLYALRIRGEVRRTSHERRHR